MGAFFFSLVNVMFNGIAELSMTVFRFPVFYKQMVSFFFYLALAFLLPICLSLGFHYRLSAIRIIVYYTIGFAPAASRLVLLQMFLFLEAFDLCFWCVLC